MSAFRVSAAGLLRLATERTLADRVAEQVWMSGHGVSPAERNAWSRSLSVLAQDLADAGLDDVEVLVEYQLPLTSRRIDAAGMPSLGFSTGGVMSSDQATAPISWCPSAGVLADDPDQGR